MTLPLEPSYLRRLKTHLCEIQKQALAPFGAVDAVPYSLYFQENFPYFTNRTGDDELEDVSSDAQMRRYTITMRLVAGHVGGGDEGEAEQKLDDYIPAVEDTFSRNHWLETADAELLELSPQPVEFRLSRGLRVFDNRGIADMPQQIGTEFVLVVEFYIDNERDY
ncbi:MAG: hypothetical protein IPK17_38505 [Chloroflexi bacterium]|uniref:hypothetical protein n=1 Tax=Candidatus Flexifilum breve TaxID=3140694 RepID=UPI003135D294|nr:hypothetical protein [Chloroflexota bacterium]